MIGPVYPWYPARAVYDAAGLKSKRVKVLWAGADIIVGEGRVIRSPFFL